MKQLFRFWIVAALLLAAGCAEVYDDSVLVDRVDDLESRVQKLEQLCQQMNTNISSLQTIVTALQNNDYVTGVTPITENGKTIGYTITFAKARFITIYHGKDGYTPVIGVKQDTDGIYYWTIDGEWLLDDAGNKIKAQGADGKDGVDGEDGADGENGKDGEDGKDGTDGINGADGKDGITPQLKIENDYWYVSYDNGASWTQLGKATGEDGKDGDSFFQSLTQDENCIYFTLADGTVITIPKGLALSIEFAESDLVVMSPNSTREIGYTVTSATDAVKVEVTSSADIKAKAVADNASGLTGKIHVTTGDAIDEYSKVIVFVSNGDKVIMRSITFEEAGLVVEENATKQASAEGGEMTLEFLSNVECEVVIPEDAQSWISVVPATRAMEKQTITLKLEPNLGANREAVVVLQNLDNSLQLEYNIVQEATIDYQLSLEREALIAIYNALDGDNWTNNENWCSDKPVSEWYGIYCNDNGTVYDILLTDNNLTGEIPKEISNLTQLIVLRLENNHLTGEIPQSITTLIELRELQLRNNQLSGTIPQNIGDLANLSSLNLGWNNLSGAIPNSITTLVNLSSLNLIDNQLSGSIPEDIGNLSNLYNLKLTDNYLSGTIPESITNLTMLYQLWLDDNQLSGTIPENIGNLMNLQELHLGSNLLTGTIPENLSNLSNLESLRLNNNHLSGDIPPAFYDWDLWKYWWWESIYGNNFKFEDLILPGPSAVVECLNGKLIDLEEEYSRNKYTILLQWIHNDTYTHLILPELKSIYDSYSDKGVKIIGWTPSGFVNNSREEAQHHIEQLGMLWDNFYLDQNGENIFGTFNHYYPGGVGDIASLTVVDSQGKIVFSDRFNIDIYPNDGYFITLLENDFKEVVIDKYETTDYSKDGEVKQLQKATKGNGIDIVLMGDAYSDRLIADGTYERTMNVAMEKFFEKEPYKSFRDHFNVYSVTAVSKNEVYIPGSSTALNCHIIEGSLIEGDDAKVFSYGLKAINKERMDNALFVVMMNSPQNAGTCVMYPPSSGDWGDGVAVAYFPVGTDDEALGQLIHHEAAGHGFAKLADEYAGTATITNENIEYHNSWITYGWWKNIDFTSDPTKVKWSHFLTDFRYANEGLGVFEGGLAYYRYGVWRPTENSIMRYNTGGFNAPSREAIYYRIHKLAYGDEWEYDYEEFVEWDAHNRTTAATRAMVYKPANYKPTHPPVIVNKSWKDAK